MESATLLNIYGVLIQDSSRGYRSSSETVIGSCLEVFTKQPLHMKVRNWGVGDL